MTQEDFNKITQHTLDGFAKTLSGQEPIQAIVSAAYSLIESLCSNSPHVDRRMVERALIIQTRETRKRLRASRENDRVPTSWVLKTFTPHKNGKTA